MSVSTEDVVIERNADREDEFIEAGAKSVWISVKDGHHQRQTHPPVNDLLRHIEDRAGRTRPVRPQLISQADLEAMEECVDGVWYTTLPTVYGSTSPRAQELRGMAAGHFAAAYHLLKTAQEIDLEDA